MRVEGSPLRVERTEVSTVVCFAFADMATVRAMESEIPGDHVQLVPGIDHDLEGLVVQLLQGAPTVFVLVHSAALPSARLDAVLTTYAKQRESNHRLCVIEYDAADPQAFLDEVADAVEDMRGRVHASADPPQRVHRPAAPVAPPPPAVAAAADEPAAVAVEPPGIVTERLEEVTSRSGPLDITTTSPGASESATFPNLNLSIENVRRGRKERARQRQRRRVRVLAALTMSVLAAAAVVFIQRSTVPANETVRATSVAPAPRRSAPSRPASPQSDRGEAEPRPLPVPKQTAADDVVDEARRVAAALDAGEIHALDALLVRTVSRSGQPISEARRRCSKLDVAGVEGWRLPTLDELRTLRRARLLPAGEFWSASWVDKESLFTLDSDITRPGERARDERVGVLCVRRR